MVRKSKVKKINKYWATKTLNSSSKWVSDRYTVWAIITLNNGRKIRVASTHFPTSWGGHRLNYMKKPMARNLAKQMNKSTQPLIVGADWNFTRDKFGLAKKTNSKVCKKGVDGVYVERKNFSMLKNYISSKRDTAITGQ